MPRSRGSEMSQTRQSPRAPLHLKPTACSEANSVHRHSSERSPKLDERRSPRGAVNEKKNGPRVADLETKLAQAQEELKKIKEQLVAVEDARREAQMELEETKRLIPDFAPSLAAAPDLEDEKEKTMNMEEENVTVEAPVLERSVALPAEDNCVNSPTTDVFEVTPSSIEGEEDDEQGTETKVVMEEENSKEEVGTGEMAGEKEEKPELAELRACLQDKESQLKLLTTENLSLRKQAEDAKACFSAASENTKEMATKLAGTEEELSRIKMTAERLREKLESEETAKVSLEVEMKRLRVQTEQWRKAAEAATAVLACGEGALLNDSYVNGSKLGKSCRSIEQPIPGYDATIGGGRWSPVVVRGEGSDMNEVAERRGSGRRIRVLGELWKRKGLMK